MDSFNAALKTAETYVEENKKTVAIAAGATSAALVRLAAKSNSQTDS